MEDIKMRTGINKNHRISTVQHTFILYFLSIIWRRVLITVYLYCKHNGVTMSSNVVLKCLKYNVLAPTGIGNTLRPYLTKALDTGFLMPEEYKNNIYAERAVKLFGEAYKIIREKKWILFIIMQPLLLKNLLNANIKLQIIIQIYESIHISILISKKKLENHI